MPKDRVVSLGERTLKLSPENKSARYFITILPWNMLTEEQKAAVEAGGEYPFDVEEHYSEHETFADYLVERSLETWTRSQD